MGQEPREEDLEKIKDKFFSNITHEFRTPLTLILGPVEQLLRTELDAHTRQRLLLVQRNALQLQRLIDELLDISKIENEDVVVEASNADFARFMHGLFLSFQPIAEEKQLSLQWEGPEDDLTLFFDHRKWQKVLYNLISNAIKFTDGGGNVFVRLHDHGDEVELQVSDTGIGIVESKLPYVFDRFYQDETHVRLYQGTGIGLSLVKELVEMMGGTIDVSSVKFQGTTFTVKFSALRREGDLPVDWVVLPPQLDEVPDTTDAKPKLRSDVYPIVDPKTKGQEAPLVLVVEDNNEMREFVRSLLDTEYEVISARNGQEGLQMAIEQVPDLIVSDVNMPEIDGFEMLRLIREEEIIDHVPIIFLTARRADEDRQQGWDEGAQAYLTKPFNEDELKSVCRSMMDLRDKMLNHLRKVIEHQKQEEERPLTKAESFLLRIQQVVDTHLDESEFGVEELSQELFMSRTQVHRKIKALTGLSTSIYVRNYKLSKSMELLRDVDKPVSEVAYELGFSSPAYFSKCFSEWCGKTPTEVQKEAANE